MIDFGFKQGFHRLPDGRKLEFFLKGAGENLIVCESGLGMGAHYWALVAEHLPAGFRLLVYNRSGLGNSSPAANERSLTSLAADLCDLVEAQEYAQVVLVGHSWGGPIIRRAVLQGIRSLKGIVLVDPTDERLLPFFTPAMLRRQNFMFKVAFRLGLLRFLYQKMLRPLPVSVRQVALRETLSKTAFAEALAETAQIRVGLQELLESPQMISGGVLISGQVPLGGEPVSRRDSIKKAHLETAKALGIEVIPAVKSSHDVALTEPSLVIQVASRFFS